ncbi:hypothetical protein Cs7R123_18140 [Catellatospora sp. TT07R-123]|uniref:hypothetical protein n=1 Tax=Catellatospora sp. TT07R-123 TaxID=2733863 RepID=UPI001B188B84|nr:hypothetical protein [Catellatospora sp. TT07R-123]GHJ44472.1 hypothetical protein Cs7R123_18140 [Catellatospora sp. TT07R-123]
MNITRALAELADDTGAPPSRLDPAAAFAAGQRRRRYRRTTSLIASVLVGVVGAGGVALAVAGRPQPAPQPAPVATDTPVVPPSAVAPRVPTGSAPAGRALLDCASVGAQVRAALRARGFDQRLAVTCAADRLTAVADLLASPIRVQLVVTVSLHQPREAARLACSGRPGVCEQAGSARLARGDGLLLTAEVSTGLPVPGTAPGRLRELVLDLDARL